MLLSWRLHENPVYDSTSPLKFDLGHVDCSAVSFNTTNQGGFADGTFTIANPNEQLIRYALDSTNGWIAKRVVATDGAGRIGYEGYVAAIDGTLNHQKYNKNLDSYCNRVFIMYAYRNSNGCPKGKTCTTGREQINENDSHHYADTDTQVRYGIKEEWIDITGLGATTKAIADATGAVYLLRKLRARETEFELGENSEPEANSLTLTFFGYYTTLQWRKQSIPITSATADIATVVKRAISPTYGNKAPFLNTDTSQVLTTGTVGSYNVKSKVLGLQDYIQGALVKGDHYGHQLFFQVLEDRRPYLFPRSTNPLYFSRHDDERIWDKDHKIVPPYLVRAGGFIIGEDANTTLDPLVDEFKGRRSAIIERTTYDDMTHKLSIPAPSNDVIQPERLLARARRQVHASIF